MSGVAVVIPDRLPGLDTIPQVSAPVWGIDPSTRRISCGLILPYHGPRVHTLSMPTGHFAHRLAAGDVELRAWLPRLIATYGKPSCVLIEEPMGRTMQQVHPSSQRALGVLLAAVAWALPRTDIDLCVPTTWKARAIGHGHASKEQVLDWSRTHCQYAGSLQDEADALAIAWTAALRLQ